MIIYGIISDVSTPNWQMGLSLGQILTDEDDIQMCIHNILFTRKGDLVLDSEFGSLIFDYIDLPVVKLIPNVIAETIAAITLYEPRVIVDTITYSVSDDFSNIRFNIICTVIASGVQIPYTFDAGQDTISRVRSFSDQFSNQFI